VLDVDDIRYGFSGIQLDCSLNPMWTLRKVAAYFGAVDILPEDNLSARRRNGKDAELIRWSIAHDGT
jgi:hypothetical protein